MPIYEYQCKKCHHRFEKIHQKFSDARVKKCPQCGGPVEQLLSAPAVQFKGSGFYVTDYARKDSGGKAKDSGPSSDEGTKKVEASSDSRSVNKDSKSEAKDSKSETKTESKSASKTETKAETKSESKSESKSDSKSGPKLASGKYDHKK